MPRSEADLKPPAGVDDVLAALNRSLRRLLLTRRDRRAVMDEVGADLRAAAADGVRPWELVGPDVDAFARATVESGGLRPRTSAYGRTVVAGLLGSAVALLAGYLLVLEVIYPRVTDVASFDDPEAFYPVLGAFVAFAGIAVVGTIGAVLALPLALHHRPAVGATCARAALLVLLAAAVAVPVVTGVSGDVGPSDQLVLAVAVAITALVGAALLLARWWALRAATRRHVRVVGSAAW